MVGTEVRLGFRASVSCPFALSRELPSVLFAHSWMFFQFLTSFSRPQRSVWKVWSGKERIIMQWMKSTVLDCFVFPDWKESASMFLMAQEWTLLPKHSLGPWWQVNSVSDPRVLYCNWKRAICFFLRIWYWQSIIAYRWLSIGDKGQVNIFSKISTNSRRQLINNECLTVWAEWLVVDCHRNLNVELREIQKKNISVINLNFGFKWPLCGYQQYSFVRVYFLAPRW